MIDALTDSNGLVTLGLVLFLGGIAGIRGFLDKSGILAAGVLGIIVGVGGHWTWLAILLIFLITGSLATRFSYDEKALMGLAEARDGARNWTNVIANGGAPGMIALLALLTGEPVILAAPFVAAVAVASADTMASEFGVLDPRVRMIVNGHIVPAGTNGGISPTGQAAALGGSLLIAMTAVPIIGFFGSGFSEQSWRVFLVIVLIGWFGCQIDSILGAMFENQGLMTKGQVNLASTLLGSLLTYLLLLLAQ